MILKFQGLVETGDNARVSDDPHGAIFIGGQDVVGTVDNTEFKKRVTVALADERYEGPLAVELGWGYSEYTPMDSDELTVGKHDVISLVSQYEGKEITLWIADEPFNTLEDEAEMNAGRLDTRSERCLD